MEIPDHIEAMFEITHTFGWLVGVKKDLNCDCCRTCGVRKTEDGDLLILITPELAKSILATIQRNSNLAFTMVNAYTFESYQFKGDYISHSFLSAQDEKMKALFMKGIKRVMGDMGFIYGDDFKRYADMEGIAIQMRVNEIFEQTPKKGTGNKLV
jgi:hypothetical protein